MFATHMNSEEDFTIKTEPTLETSQTTWKSEVSQDMVLGRVQTVQGLVAQPALVHVTEKLQLVIRVQTFYTFLLDQHLN